MSDTEYNEHMVQTMPLLSACCRCNFGVDLHNMFGRKSFTCIFTKPVNIFHTPTLLLQ